jgi:hypothetical protein
MQKRSEKMNKNKQSIYALIVGGLLILGAGVVETMPIITAVCIAGMAAAVVKGRLWDAD